MLSPIMCAPGPPVLACHEHTQHLSSALRLCEDYLKLVVQREVNSVATVGLWRKAGRARGEAGSERVAPRYLPCAPTRTRDAAAYSLLHSVKPAIHSALRAETRVRLHTKTVCRASALTSTPRLPRL